MKSNESFARLEKYEANLGKMINSEWAKQNGVTADTFADMDLFALRELLAKTVAENLVK